MPRTSMLKLSPKKQAKNPGTAEEKTSLLEYELHHHHHHPRSMQFTMQINFAQVEALSVICTALPKYLFDIFPPEECHSLEHTNHQRRKSGRSHLLIHLQNMTPILSRPAKIGFKGKVQFNKSKS